MNEKNKKELFDGVGTALITPFRNDAIDYTTLRRLINLQVSGGASAIVVAGTTGEASTLTEKERDTLLFEALKVADGRLPVIMGCGSNCTHHALLYVRRAKELGANGTLVVTPYYNKGTKEGLRTHFLRVAEATDIPLILYNVPSRTGVDLSLEDYRILFEHPNIKGAKEASASIEKMAHLCAIGGQTHKIYTGNDAMLLPSLALGAQGVISVASGLLPKTIYKIYKLFKEGHTEAAQKENARLLPLFDLLFEEVSPAPIKYALAASGLGDGSLRLPLTSPSRALQEKIDAVIGRLSEGE